MVELCIYGGSAMLLAYDSRKVTKDVDAVIKPSKAGKLLAAKVAAELGLPEDWLNDDVRRFLAPVEQRRKLPLEIAGLRVFVATADYLLAMKALACRQPLPGYRGDQEDLEFLIRKLKIRSLDEIQTRIDRFYPDDVLSDDVRLTLQRLIQTAKKDE